MLEPKKFARIYDTSVILHSPNIMFEGYITPCVLNEVKDEILREVVRGLLRNGKLKILDASDDSKRKIAKINNDLANNLSQTDIEILAAAYEYNLKIMTSDFAIQNIAKILNIPYEGLVELVDEKINKFIYVCPACEKIYKQYKKFCDACGTEIIKEEF
ncbi:putative ribonuclease VapC14 [groundwater metagenome]|uniref:Putative ribonuclease VapC14 n=1 Tax=groundwater metagenome TaxID=717931 RepID=A0A098EBG0_9ZZZZ